MIAAQRVKSRCTTAKMITHVVLFFMFKALLRNHVLEA
jgi:hypothetical protein